MKRKIMVIYVVIDTSFGIKLGSYSNYVFFFLENSLVSDQTPVTINVN